MSYDPNRATANTQREIDNTADKAHDTVDRVTDTAHNAVDNASTKVQQAADKAQDLGAQVADKAQDLGAQAKDKAQELSAQAADKADAATTTVGEKFTDAAQAIRDNAPASGTVGNVATTAADTLDRAGTYLQQQDLSDMRSDLEGIIRRHPVEALLVGFGVGYLLARSMRR